MSWYFDTENWAAGMWNSWAESRTDTWREAMVRAVLAAQGGVAGADDRSPSSPTGRRHGDFSFIVIGDTGEGDASQHVLRDQLLSRRQHARREVRRHFVGRRLSDRRDERLRSEVLAAVQGRHQAGLCHSRQSRLVRRARRVRRDVPRSPMPRARSIRARVEADLRVTSTTDGRIDDLIQQPAGCAAGLRRADRISARAVLRDPDRSIRPRGH